MDMNSWLFFISFDSVINLKLLLCMVCMVRYIEHHKNADTVFNLKGLLIETSTTFSKI